MNKPWRDEFRERFTDGFDQENDYWDSGWIESRPVRVVDFIADLIERERREAYDRGYGHGGLDMHEGNFAPLPRELKMIGK